MNDEFTARVKAAAAAGWWTILLAVLWMTVSWLWFLCLMQVRPDWLLTLWGGGTVSWETMQEIALWFFGVWKLIMWFAFLVVIWLSLWARRLRKTS
mgnify:CR=1 FL=1